MALIFLSTKKFEKHLSERASEVCDNITSEIGAEIHDDLVQKLSALGFYLDRLERSINNPEGLEILLLSMRSDFENISGSIRRISRMLMPEYMDDEPFQRCIQMLCQNMEGPGSGNVHFSCSGSALSLSPTVQRYLYRITQELIHNAFKHSSAWHVWVRIRWEDQRLNLEVEDDGTGFTKISEFIDILRKKYNTLKMRSTAIGAEISYHRGDKGLLARLEYHPG